MKGNPSDLTECLKNWKLLSLAQDLGILKYIEILGYSLLSLLACIGACYIVYDISGSNKSLDLFKIVPIFVDILAAGATIFAAFVAVKGINTWRSSLFHSDRYEMLSNLNNAVYLVKDKVNAYVLTTYEVKNDISVTKEARGECVSAFIHIANCLQLFEAKHPDIHGKLSPLVNELEYKWYSELTSVVSDYSNLRETNEERKMRDDIYPRWVACHKALSEELVSLFRFYQPNVTGSGHTTPS